jgi:Domain of unknown function (DUF4145)
MVPKITPNSIGAWRLALADVGARNLIDSSSHVPSWQAVGRGGTASDCRSFGAARVSPERRRLTNAWTVPDPPISLCDGHNVVVRRVDFEGIADGRSSLEATDTFKRSPSVALPALQGRCARATGEYADSHEETVASKNQQEVDGFAAEMVEESFSCWLECAVPNCRQKVAIVGTGFYEPFEDDEHGLAYRLYCNPRYAWPMPDVFEISDQCPAGVASELRTSFHLMWCDPNAAASRLRVALEHLLTVRRIPKLARAKNGKLMRLTLHRRLELLEHTQSQIAKNLMGVKWLGNTGSHEGNVVALDDLLKGYVVMEHSLTNCLHIGRRERLRSGEH